MFLFYVTAFVVVFVAGWFVGKGTGTALEQKAIALLVWEATTAGKDEKAIVAAIKARIAAVIKAL